MTTVDCIGLALDLEARAKTVESQTTERAMLSAAQGLRLLASEQALTALTVEQQRLGMYDEEKAKPAPTFLANGARFKVMWDDSDFYISGLPHDLNGRWVALVAADDNCHLEKAKPDVDKLDAQRYRVLRDHRFTYSPVIHPPHQPEAIYLPVGLDAVCDEMLEDLEQAGEVKP